MCLSQTCSLRLRGGAGEGQRLLRDPLGLAKYDAVALQHLQHEYVTRIQVENELRYDEYSVLVARHSHVRYSLCDRCWHRMTPVVARSLQLVTERFWGGAVPELVRIIVDEWNKLMIHDWRWRHTQKWLRTFVCPEFVEHGCLARMFYEEHGSHATIFYINDICRRLQRARLTYLYPFAARWGAIGDEQSMINERRRAITDVFGAILTGSERDLLHSALTQGWRSLSQHPRWALLPHSQWYINL